jgi:hypothetical protein
MPFSWPISGQSRNNFYPSTLTTSVGFNSSWTLSPPPPPPTHIESEQNIFPFRTKQSVTNNYFRSDNDNGNNNKYSDKSDEIYSLGYSPEEMLVATAAVLCGSGGMTSSPSPSLSPSPFDLPSPLLSSIFCVQTGVPSPSLPGQVLSLSAWDPSYRDNGVLVEYVHDHARHLGLLDGPSIEHAGHWRIRTKQHNHSVPETLIVPATHVTFQWPQQHLNTTYRYHVDDIPHLLLMCQELSEKFRPQGRSRSS